MGIGLSETELQPIKVFKPREILAYFLRVTNNCEPTL